MISTCSSYLALSRPPHCHPPTCPSTMPKRDLNTQKNNCFRFGHLMCVLGLVIHTNNTNTYIHSCNIPIVIIFVITFEGFFFGMGKTAYEIVMSIENCMPHLIIAHLPFISPFSLFALTHTHRVVFRTKFCRRNASHNMQNTLHRIWRLFSSRILHLLNCLYWVLCVYSSGWSITSFTMSRSSL